MATFTNGKMSYVYIKIIRKFYLYRESGGIAMITKERIIKEERE